MVIPPRVAGERGGGMIELHMSSFHFCPDANLVGMRTDAKLLGMRTDAKLLGMRTHILLGLSLNPCQCKKLACRCGLKPCQRVFEPCRGKDLLCETHEDVLRPDLRAVFRTVAHQHDDVYKFAR